MGTIEAGGGTRGWASKQEVRRKAAVCVFYFGAGAKQAPLRQRPAQFYKTVLVDGQHHGLVKVGPRVLARVRGAAPCDNG